MASRQVLTPAQRQRRKAYGIDSFLRRRNFRERKDVLYDTLDTFAFRLSKHSRDGIANPLHLADLARVIVAGDRGIAEFFSTFNRGSATLRDDDGWEDLFRVLGGALVERYLAEREPPTVADVEPIVHERRREEVAELIGLAIEAARLSEAAGQALNEALYEAPFIPNLQDWAARQLEELIEADSTELVFFDPAEDAEEPIPRRERDREVAKGALMRLSVTELREIAGEDAPGGTANMDALTSFIVDRFGADPATIAEMIHYYERPPAVRGLVTRLVSLSADPDLAATQERVEAFRGRYMRVGVARWLIFEASRFTSGELVLRGRIRYYNPTVRVEYGEYGIDVGLGSGDVEMRLRESHRWLELSINRAGDVGGTAKALERVAAIQPNLQLPILAAATEGQLMQFDPRTLQMLDFIATGFRDPGMQVRDMTMARFESDTTAGDAGRPSIKAVRLEGAYLDSHPQACAAIAQGRALLSVDLTLDVGLAGGRERIPIQLELSRGHAAVSTALTSIPESETARVHRDLTRRFEVSLAAGVRDLQGLEQLGERIAERARQQTANQPDMLIRTPQPDGIQQTDAESA